MEQIPQMVFEFLFSSSSSSGSSSSEEDEDLDILLARQYIEKYRRRKVIERIPFAEEDLNDGDFKQHFRMNRTTMEFLLTIVGPYLERQGTGNQPIPPKKQLIVGIWKLATPDSYRSIANNLGVSKVTAVRAVHRVSYVLTMVSPDWVKWPEDLELVEANFRAKRGFPGIVGCLDSTHIEIPKPRRDTRCYFNRKKFCSLNLMAVCDDKLKFTYCFVGCAGGIHDSHVLEMSDLGEYMEDINKFPLGTHLLADSAYALTNKCMVPYRNNGHLNNRKKHFNKCLSSARIVIERAFGLLKVRFRSIREKLAVASLKQAVIHIMACCVLHNLCLHQGDRIEEKVNIENDDEDMDAEEMANVEAEEKRALICNELYNHARAW